MELDRYLASLVGSTGENRFSSYQFAVSIGGEQSSGCGGRLSLESSVQTSMQSKFDLASITKLFTATVAALLSSRGDLDLSAPISSWSGLEFHSTQATITSRELLTHVSGLPAEWQEAVTREGTIESLLKTPASQSQRGQLLYACTGYSLFALALEVNTGRSIADWVSELITTPLGLSSVSYRPVDSANCVEACLPGEGIAQGTVHDPRARALGGVSGNAGLFGSALDLVKFAIEISTGSHGIVDSDARNLLSEVTAIGDWGQAIGFRRGDVHRIGNGRDWLSHSGFTGTLLVADKNTETYGVLLTNRLTRSTTKEQMAEVYKTFCDYLAS